MPATHQPKVFCNVFSRVRVPGAAIGSLRFVIEYVYMTDPQRSGKFTHDSAPIRNASDLQDELTDALAAHLAVKYAPETYRARDIVWQR